MKKIIASLAAVATVLSLSVAAFAEADPTTDAPAADPGSTNGLKTSTVKVEADKPTQVTFDNGVAVSAPAGAFEAGVEVTFEVKPEPADQAAVATTLETLQAKDKDAAINTVIDVTVKDKDGKVVQPAEGKKVTVTVAYDGVSNAIAYVDDKNNIEWIKLTVSEDKKTASFETGHFSAFYMVTVSDDILKQIDGVTGDPEKPGTDDKNKPTGVAIAIIPAAIAAAAVVVSKKRK